MPLEAHAVTGIRPFARHVTPVQARYVSKLLANRVLLVNLPVLLVYLYVLLVYVCILLIESVYIYVLLVCLCILLVYLYVLLV